MKYKLLSVHNGGHNNIGDYVQALASSQFLPSIDGFINREQLDDYNDEECKVIMNGWYMHNPQHWPPSSKICPLFVAFHLNTSVADKMLSNEGVSYLKAHEPIGCRDTNTMKLLKDKGIKAYFSGCMTLTLGKRYITEEKNDIDYFVDPIIPKSKNLLTNLKNIFYYFYNLKNVNIVAAKLYQTEKLTIKRRLISAGFLRLYSRIIDKSMVVHATYINQENAYYADAFDSDFDRLKEAERLIKLYAKARLVVTNRIHCALPCLGLNTPVIYTLDMNDSEISTCRFGGLVDLFNVVVCGPNKIDVKDISYVSPKSIPHNKQTWKELANRLSQKCIEFINTDK